VNKFDFVYLDSFHIEKMSIILTNFVKMYTSIHIINTIVIIYYYLRYFFTVGIHYEKLIVLHFQDCLLNKNIIIIHRKKNKKIENVEYL